ncbi:DUF6274 family protein [Streptomyces sp. NPDC058008]|uniref:DUF6274 family protein n=1 Tax=Streptomyces sp. NPDC058008 TaxID=3346303 RepID=UPI0036EE987F
MPAPTERHETRALLRAHLAAASGGYRHLTRQCPICHRLLRLAMEPLTVPQAPYAARESGDAAEPPTAPQNASGAPSGQTRDTPLATRSPTVGDGPGTGRRPGRPDGLHRDGGGDESPAAT